MAHLLGWLLLAVLAFAQAPGRTAADTKLDLSLDPAGFLTQATSAYTDQFTLGQIQNQAYGYLFPQGPFFLLTEPLPDWVAQRIWWTIVMGVAYSGTLILARRLGMRHAWLPAVLYALSPRILTTLTAISSEAWPVALVPWTLIPLAAYRVTWRHAAAAVVPVALMGAVNATATLLACIPAGVLLLYRRQWRVLGLWLAGCAAVSAWWIVPLVVLGRFSPPFTDYIESAFTTTYWLNLAEILRGTTSWTPFVDTERVAGHLLVTEPVFVLATMAVAAVGVAGLAARSMPWRGYFITLMCLGVAVLGAAHGPLGSLWVSLLDDPLAPFRNLHKLDPVVRLPLVLGVGWVVSRIQWKRPVILAGVCLVAVAATAPAWSLRMAPQGTWEDVPEYWYEAAAFLDEHAAGTRTLVLPAESFARQDWGWTRDEPIQALANVPFAVRDAIPLVDSETIRGLDGLRAVAESAGFDHALRGFGIGAVLVRHDTDSEAPDLDLDADLDAKKHTFGKIDIYLIDPARDMMLADSPPVTVAGGGESIPLLNSLFGYAPRHIVTENAQIVTDTPALAVRNYGTLDGASSAHLCDASEGTDITNRVPDYVSAGTRVSVAENGGTARASSSAADASSFGGANPSRSLTSAFDGRRDTAWWPQPGDIGWIESTVADGKVTITATRSTEVIVTSGDFQRTLSVSSYSPRTIAVPGDTVRVQLTEPVGIAELDTGVSRLVTVPDTSPNAGAFVFQRLMPATGTLQRGFTTHQDDTWELSAPATIDGNDHPAGPVELEAGFHTLDSEAEVLTLSRSTPNATWAPFSGTIPANASEQRLLTTRSFNDGLRARIGGTELSPQRIDAGQTSFLIPAGLSGEVTFSFAGDRPYRVGLLAGAVVGVVGVAVLVCCACVSRRVLGPAAAWTPATGMLAPTAAAVSACILVGGIPGAIGAATALAIRRFTLIPGWILGPAALVFTGLWLARAPWPTPGYAGDSVAVVLAGSVALVAMAWPGRSTSS